MRRWLLAVFILSNLTTAGAGTLVQFRTVYGELQVELFDRDKPITVGNFIRYARAGAYTDSFFHRADPGFVIQGGAFTVVGRGTPEAVPAAVSKHDSIPNEFGVGPFHSNVFGALAMAKTSDPDSATSSFFFNLADNAISLDDTNNSGGFTVFGRVLQGTNVLQVFNEFAYARTPPTNLVVNVAGTPFDELPVVKLVEDPEGGLSVDLADLVYVDVSLLQVEVENVEGLGRRISWNSVAGRPNHVEYTTGFPPEWQTLAIEPGTGERLQVLDAESAAAYRFYRVRIDY